MGSLSKDCDDEEGENYPDTQFPSFVSISVHHMDYGIPSTFGNGAGTGTGQGKED